MLSKEVVHLGSTKQFGNILLKEFFEKLFGLLFAQSLWNFNFFLFFLLLLFLFVFLLLDAILNSHVIKFKVNDAINEFLQLVLDLWPDLIFGQLNIVIFRINFSGVSATPSLGILLNSILKLNHLISRSNVNMLI